MSRKPTPPPESRFIGGGGVIVFVWGAVFIPLAIWLGMWWVYFFLIPVLFYLEYLARGLCLLAIARVRWWRTSIRGVLVLSDSPYSKPYIEDHWLSRFGEKVVVLNHSEQKTWRRTLSVMIFRRFGHSDDNFNFYPLVIYFRGLRYPFVYRYYYAFRDAKHGNFEALHRLEAHMFDQFGVQVEHDALPSS